MRIRPQAEARDDEGFTLEEDGSITISSERLLSNDADGDRMIIGQVYDAVNGTVSLNSDGNIVFTPFADFNGVARFSYGANTPEGGRADAIVTLNVTAVNDAPEAANDSGYQTLEETPFQIWSGDLLANDSDLDGDSLTLVSVAGNENVAVELTDDGYVLVTPAAYFFGTASFTYTVADPDGLESTATVSFYVEPVNNAPEPQGDSYSMDEDDIILISATDLIANDLEWDGDPLTVTQVFGAQNGTATLLDNGTIEFRAGGNFNGEARFTYRVDDGQGGQGDAVVTVTVNPVNDIPTPNNDIYVNISALNGFEDEPIIIPISLLLANDTDIEDGGVQFVDVSAGINGDITYNDDGDLVFTPDQDFWGATSFSYSVRDTDGAVNSATVSLWFENVGDAPPVANTDVIELYEDTPIVIPFSVLLGNDTDIDRDELRVVGWQSRGVYFDLNGEVTFTEDGTGFIFTPNLNVPPRMGSCMLSPMMPMAPLWGWSICGSRPYKMIRRRSVIRSLQHRWTCR